ncbi:ABC transporter substrate-binding protein [Calidifontibacillus erzurumensis]|nr:ABC transporter substrate-binding protein [Calidifontibacillus erzurumensis]
MKNCKIYFSLITAFLLMFTLIGCGNMESKNENSQPSKQTESDQQAQSGSFPVTVTDASGSEIKIEKKPTRIVSLMPSNTEIVFALGAGDSVVGVTEWDNYPEEVLEIEKVGGLDFNVEKVLSLKPDLVLAHASSMQNANDYGQIRDIGIPVIVVPNAQSFNEVYESITLIGNAVGANQEAERIIDDMKKRLDVIKEKASKISEDEMKTVWVEIMPEPDLYTTGKGTFIDDILNLIHAKNAAGAYEGWIKFTEEDAILLNPDVILLTYGFYVENPTEKVYQREAWKDVPAVKNKQVFAIDSDKFNRTGPRLIEGVEELASFIYPEVFSK